MMRENLLSISLLWGGPSFVNVMIFQQKARFPRMRFHWCTLRSLKSQNAKGGKWAWGQR